MSRGGTKLKRRDHKCSLSFGHIRAPFFLPAMVALRFAKAKGEPKWPRKKTDKLQTAVNENGEVVYQAPIEITGNADLANYGITWEDCRTLHFGRSEKIIVYYFPTTNRRFAEEQWRYLNTQHSKGYRSMRCMVPGKQKPLIVCPDSNKCSECPYGRSMEDRQSKIISWEGLIETGYEPAGGKDETENTDRKMDIEKVITFLERRVPGIVRIIVLKEVYGYSVAEIAEEVGITERRVYYYLNQAKKIGKEYKERHGRC